MRWTHEDEMYAIEQEAERAARRYGPFRSTHEGLGVLVEEAMELTRAIHSNDLGDVGKEAIQVAAVAYRLAVQCRTKEGEFHERSRK